MTAKSPDWSDAELISKALVSARRSAAPLAAYPASLPRSLDIAYAVQSSVIDAWGDEIGGWKVARINGQWKDELGSDRYIGPVFSRTIASTGHYATLPVFRHGGAFEAEVALILNDDADPTRLDWTIEDAASLTDTARLVVEAAGAPVNGLAVLGPLASVTAFGNNNGMILGAEYEIKRLKGQTATASVDGKVVGKALLWPDPAGVLPAFAFALGKAAAIGRPLRKGQFVSTGALTGIHSVMPGQKCLASFGDLERIECTVTLQGEA